jgi:hypothetical protein
MDSLSGRDLMASELPKDIHIPTTADLYEALENILWFWPGIFVQMVKDGQGQLDFDLSRSVRLTGKYEGLVMLKTSEALGRILAQALLENHPSSPEDAFNEFSNMFCGHIMNKIRASDKVAFRHFLPLTAPESSRPTRPPEARMTVAVESIVLDVQLWINRIPAILEKEH